jgi:YbbR domain-containing protein
MHQKEELPWVRYRCNALLLACFYFVKVKTEQDNNNNTGHGYEFIIRIVK